jgi:hypothetical protein
MSLARKKWWTFWSYLMSLARKKWWTTLSDTNGRPQMCATLAPATTHHSWQLWIWLLSYGNLQCMLQSSRDNSAAIHHSYSNLLVAIHAWLPSPHNREIMHMAVVYLLVVDGRRLYWWSPSDSLRLCCECINGGRRLILMVIAECHP